MEEWVRLQVPQPRSLLTHASTDLEQIDPCGLSRSALKARWLHWHFTPACMTPFHFSLVATTRVRSMHTRIWKRMSLKLANSSETKLRSHCASNGLSVNATLDNAHPPASTGVTIWADPVSSTMQPSESLTQITPDLRVHDSTHLPAITTHDSPFVGSSLQGYSTSTTSFFKRHVYYRENDCQCCIKKSYGFDHPFSFRDNTTRQNTDQLAGAIRIFAVRTSGCCRQQPAFRLIAGSYGFTT